MKSVYIIIAIFALCSSSQLVSAECQDKGSSFCQKWVQAFGKDICHWRFMPSSCAKACGYCELEGNFKFYKLKNMILAAIFKFKYS